MNGSTDTRDGVTILGSANLDVVFVVDRIPAPGETILAGSVERYPGGKGLNQAVASARSGASTTFIGAIGTDDAGDLLAQTMADAGIASTLVRREPVPTGQAFIVVDAAGENTIVVASGANATLSTLDPADARALANTTVLLLQLELPVALVTEAAATARSAGAVVMLNAAPARTLPPELLRVLDVLIVNEHEACLVGGSSDLATASATLAALVPRLIVTLGSAGSVLFEGGEEFARITAPRVTAIDTTGAGDTFCGAFAAAIAEGLQFEPSARLATVAAALSVQAVGAVPSMPTRAQIESARFEAAPLESAPFESVPFESAPFESAP